MPITVSPNQKHCCCTTLRRLK
uniref:Uncharacterized protein n=1 Tax=Rhizophora mucronata TaxID=61149 RepID=A0A2P2PW67_RHIMU